MISKEIEKLKQELYEIQCIPDINTQLEHLQEFAKRIGALMPCKSHTGGVEHRENSNGTIRNAYISTPADKKTFIDKTICNIYTMLQTEMMFNACIFAKHSCFWAAIAAIAACLSVILVLFYG